MTAPVLQPDVVRLRLGQLPALLRPLLSAVRWQPSIGAIALAALLLALKADDLGAGGTALMLLRGVAALLALGAAFLLDDPAANTVAGSPTSLAWRRSHRLALLAMLVGTPWTLAVLAVQSRGTDVPIAGLTLELATLLAVGLAAGAIITRWTDAPEPGVFAAPLTVGILLTAFRLPEQCALFVPRGPLWGPAHERWALVLAAAVLAFLQCTRDPAHPRLWSDLIGGSSRLRRPRARHQTSG